VGVIEDGLYALIEDIDEVNVPVLLGLDKVIENKKQVGFLQPVDRIRREEEEAQV